LHQVFIEENMSPPADFTEPTQGPGSQDAAVIQQGEWQVRTDDKGLGMIKSGKTDVSSF
jgi:hypothetical protein